MTSKKVSVSYHSAAEARLPANSTILEDRWLHQVFLITHIPVNWSTWQLALGLIPFLMFVWLVWYLLTPLPRANQAVQIYLLFVLSDWLLLRRLPREGRSFGPIGPQLFVMTIPRLGAVVVTALLAVFINPVVGWASHLGLQFFGSIVYFWSALYEPFALGVTHKSLNLSHFPANAPPIRLLHLSDLHVERLTRREDDLLEQIEQLNPDLIVFTGDFLNLSYVDDPIARAEVRKVLMKLDAPYGVYATLGSPPVDPRDTTPSLLDDTDIRLLRDEVAVLTFEDGRTISLLGLDCEHDLDSDASAFKRMVELTPADSSKILLYHSPELMPLVQQYPIDLYLCGHTHGGQIRMPLYGALLTSSVLGKQYEMGPYLEQDTLLYISRGIGLEGMGAPRMRLLCKPEIILFELEGSS
ncbi:MAG: metallophosphoesterase [Chloroflexota bacterium]